MAGHPNSLTQGYIEGSITTVHELPAADDLTLLTNEVQHHIAAALADCLHLPDSIDCRIDYEFRADPTRVICFGDTLVSAGVNDLDACAIRRFLVDAGERLAAQAQTFRHLPRFGRVVLYGYSGDHLAVETVRLMGKYRNQSRAGTVYAE